MKKLILIATILSFGMSLFAQEKQIIDKVVAIVGSNMVTLSDIEAQYFQYQAQGAKATADLKCQIYENMILQKLLVAQAAIDSVEVTEKEVQAELDSRLLNFIRQAGSEQALEEYFNKSIEEIKEDFKDDVREQLLTGRMQNNILGEISVTPAEVNSFYRELPKDSLPLIEAEFEYAQILLYPDLSKDEIQAVYDKLNDFKTRVESGKSKFATLAVLYSKDPGSAANGGELGFVSRGELVPEFAAAAFNLKPNEISKVVKTDYGYHIIQLIERKGDQVNVRHILLQPEISFTSEKSASNKLDSIAMLISVDSLSFEEAAMRFSQDKDTRLNGGKLINMYTGTSKFTIKEINGEDLAYLKKMKIGEISKPVISADKTGAKVYKILKLISMSEAHIANLEKDYQRIQELATEKKKQNELYEWVLEKQKSNYIKIDDEYKSCNFHYKGWLSK
jgi:peptidyl-prolyl cis-trans isomerase SurA